MDWLLFAQTVTPGPAEWGNLIVSLGTGTVAVWFAMKWVERSVEAHKVELTTLREAHAAEKKTWQETLEGIVGKDQRILELLMQKGKVNS